MTPVHADEHPVEAVPASQRRALTWALALNGGFLFVEIIGGLVLGSLALLADAAHMVGDVVGLGIALAGTVLAGRPISARHSFGFARAGGAGPLSSSCCQRPDHRRGDPRLSDRTAASRRLVDGGGLAGLASTWSAP